MFDADVHPGKKERHQRADVAEEGVRGIECGTDAEDGSLSGAAGIPGDKYAGYCPGVFQGPAQ